LGDTAKIDLLQHQAQLLNGASSEQIRSTAYIGIASTQLEAIVAIRR